MLEGTHQTKQQLLLRHQLRQAQKHSSSLLEPTNQFLNSNGIVSPFRLLLTIVLIMLSISSLFHQNNTHKAHIKAITNYFSAYVLGQNGLSIYDQGDNLDETYIQITTFSQMRDHFINLVSEVQKYEDKGFANFSRSSVQTVDAEFYYWDGSQIKVNLTFLEFRKAMINTDMREFLLSLRALYFQVDFGDNKMVDDFRLIFDYEIYSNSMLQLTMSTKYKVKAYQGAVLMQTFMKSLQKLLAAILIISYIKQTSRINHDDSLSKQFQKNSTYWCYSLIFLNLIIMLSSYFSPFCAIMQLLPVFQNHDSSNTLTYNFNVNLRYAWVIVFKVILPVYMILSGFILYSMLMYPGDYFDDYWTGFFSYFYNNFQYGIYQIFMEVGSKGTSAYFLYIILYFYMVLVGSNLVPALFCTLIYQKMAERDLMRYIQTKLEMIMCPKCKKENYTKSDYGIEININSPKSPYLKSGTTLKKSPTLKSRQKTAKMYIQDSNQLIKSPQLSPQLTLKTKHKKAKDLVKDLEECVSIGYGGVSYKWMETKVREIQEILEEF